MNVQVGGQTMFVPTKGLLTHDGLKNNAKSETEHSLGQGVTSDNNA